MQMELSTSALKIKFFAYSIRWYFILIILFYKQIHTLIQHSKEIDKAKMWLVNHAPDPPPSWPHLPETLCVQMDFMQTFEANAKCNNINHVWSQYHRCIKGFKVVYLTFFGIFKYAPTNICVKDIHSWASMVLQNY